MDRNDALKAIRAADVQTRLRGARALMRCAAPSDLSEIRQVLSTETVPWIKSALRKVQFHLEGVKLPARADEDEEWSGRQCSEIEDIRRETIGQVLHELSPAIGRLKLAALSQVPDFEESELAQEFQRVEDLIDLFGRWRRISVDPRYSDFDVAELIGEVLEEEDARTVHAELHAQHSMRMRSDRGFLKAALANGLRNAIQAIESKGPSRRGDERVIVTFGQTDKVAWIAINDQGIGLPTAGEKIFRATTTTKPGHSGLGLPIALQAIRKLGGKLSLVSSEPEGARFLIEVPMSES